MELRHDGINARAGFLLALAGLPFPTEGTDWSMSVIFPILPTSPLDCRILSSNKIHHVRRLCIWPMNTPHVRIFLIRRNDDAGRFGAEVEAPFAHVGRLALERMDAK